jgi:hypothetical protein
LKLRVCALSLPGWVMALPSVQSLCVIVRGTLQLAVPRHVQDQRTAEQLPVLLRSPFVEKQVCGNC